MTRCLSRGLPHGLYDLTIINPDGQRVTEAERYLVERGVETEVTLGIGGPRTLATGESATYSVSLQNLGNLDTPYVRFDFGVPEMGVSADVLEGLQLPYLVFGSSVGGRPDGRTIDLANNSPLDAAEMRDQLNSLKTLMENLVPIGAVIAWFKNTPGVPALPPNFVECNGQFLTAPSPIAFSVR